MAVDAMAPSVATSPTATALIKQYRQAFVVHRLRFQITTGAQFWEMIEKVFYISVP